MLKDLYREEGKGSAASMKCGGSKGGRAALGFVVLVAAIAACSGIDPGGRSLIDSTELPVEADAGGGHDGEGGAPPDASSDATAAPVFDPDPGTFDSALSVRMTTATPGAVVRYTTDGSEPTPASTLYSVPISIARTTTVKAAAYRGEFAPSAVREATYTVVIPSDVTAPVSFEPNAGDRDNGLSVTLSSESDDASLCYTLDGTTPSCDGTNCKGASRYVAPIPIAATGRVIVARACSAGRSPSAVTRAEYSLTAGAPTFSPASGADNPSSVTLASTTSGAVLHYTTDGSPASCSTPATLVSGSPLPGGPFTVDTTVRAVACKANYVASAEKVATYKVRPPSPIITPGTSTSATNLSVAIEAAPDAVVCYTVGAEPVDPSCDGAVCTGMTETPIAVERSGTIIKAIACRAGNSPSPMVSAIYTLRPGPPAFDPPGNSAVPLGGLLAVTVTSERATKIAFTLDGTSPSCEGGDGISVVSAPAALDVSENQTVTAVGCRRDYAPSEARQATFPDVGSVAAPSFTPPGGVHFDDVEVRLSSSEGANVCYTVDASEPRCEQATARCTHGTKWSVDAPPSSGIPVTTSGVVVKALACKVGLFNSSVRAQTYRLKVGQPVVDPPGPSYEAGTPLAIATETTGDVTFHATVGANPPDATCASPTIAPDGALPSLPFGMDLSIVACKKGYEASDARRIHYLPSTARPLFAPGGGTFASAPSVGIDSATRSRGGVPTKICYTLDGSAPACEQQSWTCAGSRAVHTAMAPVSVDVSGTLRAIACAREGTLSFPTSSETTAVYVIGEPER